MVSMLTYSQKAPIKALFPIDKALQMCYTDYATQLNQRTKGIFLFIFKGEYTPFWLCE